MPRTTRAAARADPALVDETMTLAEIAIAEDTTVVNMDQAATESEHGSQTGSLQPTRTQRSPLGEITTASGRINQAELTAMETSSSEDGEAPPVVAVENSESDDVHAQSENIVLVLRQDSKGGNAAKPKKGKKASPKKQAKGAPKNSIRLTVKDPSAKDSSRQPTVSTAKEASSSAGTRQAESPIAESSLDNALITDSSLSCLASSEDEFIRKLDHTVLMATKVDGQSSSASPEPLKAAALLKEPSKEVVNSGRYKELRRQFLKELYDEATQETAPATAVSPAAFKASKVLEKKQSPSTVPENLTDQRATRSNASSSIKVKLPAIKRKQVPSSTSFKPVASSSVVSTNSSIPPKSTEASKESRPRAVQKLTSLFEPQQEGQPEKKAALSTLDEMAAAQPMSPLSDSRDPIEAMDALEENIAVIEKSIADCNQKPSSSKRTKPTPVNSSKKDGNISNADSKQKNPISGSVSKTKPEVSSKRSSNIANRRTVEALNTPPQLQKSSKPKTTSNFSLSSEATAARLKAQREERQKRREEEEQKQKLAKFKPIKTQAKPLEVKTTTASRARMSLLADRPKETELSNKPSAKRQSALTASTVARVQGLSASTGRHSQSISPAANTNLATRLSSTTRATKVTGNHSSVRNSLPYTARKATRPSTMHAASKRPSLATAPSSNSATNSKTSSNTANVDKSERATRELTVGEKAEAAKKARLEAAERGRAASRVWAEKKRGPVAACKPEPVSENTAAQGTAPIEEVDESEGNKENEDQEPVEPFKLPEVATASNCDSFKMCGLANSILIGNTVSQEDAAYIVAEMKRIDKRRSTAGEFWRDNQGQ